MGQEPAPQEPAGPEPQATPAAQPAEKSFPESHVRELRQEAAKYRTEKAELEARLQEFEDRDKTAAEKLEQRASKAETRLSDAEAKLARYEVAAEAGLALKHAGRIQGKSRDEMLADAKSLADEFGKPAAEPAPTPFDGGARDPVTPSGTPEEEHQKFIAALLGRPD